MNKEQIVELFVICMTIMIVSFVVTVAMLLGIKFIDFMGLLPG